MEPADITNLLPLGGASVLLVYLLRIIAYERGRWISEREALIEEHRQEMERRNKEHAEAVAQWRSQYESMRADYERVLGFGEKRGRSP